jgi:hypothetical protein
MADSIRKKPTPITNFFGPPKLVLPAFRPDPQPAAAPAAVTTVIDVDAHPESDNNSHPTRMLARLRALTVSLPSSVPVGTSAEPLGCFASDPQLLLLPGQDTWEDVIDPTYNRVLGFGKTTVEISGIIRRGKFGMDGVCNWTQSCIKKLDIAPALLEMRLDRLMQAIINVYVICIFQCIWRLTII